MPVPKDRFHTSPSRPFVAKPSGLPPESSTIVAGTSRGPTGARRDGRSVVSSLAFESPEGASPARPSPTSRLSVVRSRVPWSFLHRFSQPLPVLPDRRSLVRRLGNGSPGGRCRIGSTVAPRPWSVCARWSGHTATCPASGEVAVHSDAMEPPWLESHCKYGSDLSAPAEAETDVRSGLRWPKPSQSCGTGPLGCRRSGLPTCPATGDAPVPKDLHITDIATQPASELVVRTLGHRGGCGTTRLRVQGRRVGRLGRPKPTGSNACALGAGRTTREMPSGARAGTVSLRSTDRPECSRPRKSPRRFLRALTRDLAPLSSQAPVRPSPAARSLSSIGVCILPGTGVVASHSSGVALDFDSRRNLGRGLSLPNRT
jgi:hypothetical protein